MLVSSRFPRMLSFSLCFVEGSHWHFWCFFFAPNLPLTDFPFDYFDSQRSLKPPPRLQPKIWWTPSGFRFSFHCFPPIVQRAARHSVSNPASSDPPGSHDENHYGQLWLQSPRSSYSKHVIEMWPRLHMMKSLIKICARLVLSGPFLAVLKWHQDFWAIARCILCTIILYRYLFHFPFLKCQVDTSDRSDMSAWHICLSFTPEANKTTPPLADALPPPPTASGDLEAQPHVQRCMVWLDGPNTWWDQ